MDDCAKLKDPGTCRIFFSSPFGGMEEEREELTKKYFPQIHHACNAKGIKFVPVDMRWGITKEAADNGQVMSICLREVSRSDFFVGFFGQRYGWHSANLNDSTLMENFDKANWTYPWIDQFRDRSVTEIEFRAGHLNKPGALPACFCFREKEYDDFKREEGLKVGDKSKVYKYTVESGFADNAMKALIKEVAVTENKTWGVKVNCKNPHEQQFLSNPMIKTVNTVEVELRKVVSTDTQILIEKVLLKVKITRNLTKQMAKFMFDAVWKFLTEVVLKEVNKEEVPFLVENRLVHDKFVSSASRIYCGCENYQEELMLKIDSQSKGTVISGPAGCGKSALLANWLLSVRKTHPHVSMIYHFIGCAPGTEKPRNILERIHLELRDLFPTLYSKTSAQDCSVGAGAGTDANQNNVSSGKKEKPTINKVVDDNEKKEISNPSKSGLEEKTIHQLINEITLLMNQITVRGHKVIIILDALNQLTSMGKTYKHLYWLPENFPSGITFICSTLDSDTASHDLLVKERGMDLLMINPYEEELQQKLCVATLKVAGKEMSPNQLERVVNARETSNALFLKLVLYELSIYGSFEKLDAKIDSLILVSGVKLLLQVILERLESDYNYGEYNGNLVKDVLCCLTASKKGLSESELCEILNVSTYLWSPLFFALEHLLSQYTGLLGFAFADMKEAIKDRYLSDPAELVRYKKKLVNYFDSFRKTIKPWMEAKTKPEYIRMVEELPWLQVDLEDKEGLITTLSDLSILAKFTDGNENDFMHLWRQTNLPWSSVYALYIKAFDETLAYLYEEMQNGLFDPPFSPGMKLQGMLQAMRILFVTAQYNKGIQLTMERVIRILETCDSSLSKEKRAEYLRDARFCLAGSYTDDKVNKSLPLYMSIFEECECLLKEKEDKVAKSMLSYVCDAIGWVYCHKKDYEKGLGFIEKSRQLNKEMKRKMNEASSTMKVAMVYTYQKKYNEALPLFFKAEKMFNEYFFGQASIHMGNLYTDLALTYRQMNDLDKAEEYYFKSLQMEAVNVGWNHPLIATSYMNLGTLEGHRKAYKKAEEWTRKALAIYEVNEFSVTDRQHRRCRENLCLNIMRQGKEKENIPLYLEVANILVDNGWMDECLGILHRTMLDFLCKQGGYKKEVEKILVAILGSETRRARFAVMLANLDAETPQDERPVRPKELTLEHFLEEYPSDSSLKMLNISSVLAQKNEIDEIIKTCRKLDRNEKNLKQTAYVFAAGALSQNKFSDSALKISELGLKKYPDSFELVAEAARACCDLKKLDYLADLTPKILAGYGVKEVNEYFILKLAVCLHKSPDHYQLAAEAFRKILDVSKNSAILEMVQKKLKNSKVPSSEGNSG